MIIEGLLELIYGLFEIIFSFIELPPLPVEIQNVIDTAVSYMLGGIGFLKVFIDFDFLGILVPIVIIIINLDKIWKLVMFVLRKIPFLGIE